MRWPLALASTVDYERQRTTDERARYDRLLDTVLAMKPQGAIVVGGLNGPRPMEPRQSTAIERAIDSSKYARNPAVRAKLQAYAEKALAAGETEKEIVRVLTSWDTVTTNEQPDDDDTIALVM